MILFLTSNPVCRPLGAPRDTFYPLEDRNRFAETLRSVLPVPARILFISSDPDFYARTDEAAAMYQHAFALSGISIAPIDVCDHRRMDQDVRDYDLLILAGGHVPTENAFFQELRLKEKLRSYGGVVMGISAGTMNCASTVYAQPELEGEATDPSYRCFIPGLGLTELNILPHWQMIRHEKVDGLDLEDDITLPDSMGRRFYCIADGSYILVRDGVSTLYGQGWLARDGVLTELCTPEHAAVLSSSENT